MQSNRFRWDGLTKVTKERGLNANGKKLRPDTYQGCTLQKVKQAVAIIIDEHGLTQFLERGNGLERWLQSGSTFWAEFELAFGTGVTLEVRSDAPLGLYSSSAIEDTDFGTVRKAGWRVQVSWGSAGARSVSSALAALDLYEKVTRCAAHIELVLQACEVLIDAENMPLDEAFDKMA